jgi:hypothetical protein
MENDADGSGWDYETTCPLAQWVVKDDGGIEFGIPGKDSCASVKNEGSYVYGWPCHILCRVMDRLIRTRKMTREEAVQEVLFWLQKFPCPGRYPSAEGAGPQEDPTATPET